MGKAKRKERSPNRPPKRVRLAQAAQTAEGDAELLATGRVADTLDELAPADVSAEAVAPVACASLLRVRPC